MARTTRQRQRHRQVYHFGIIRNGIEAAEKAKCRRNPIHFMKTHLKVDHPTKGLIPFALFLFQEFLIKTFIEKRNTIVLKPRQMGVTTIVAAFVLWLCMFHGYKKVVLISIKYSMAKSMLRRIKTMYRNLPDYLKEPTVNGTRPDAVGTESCIEFANHSMITAITSSEEAARSEANSLCVLDEAAFIRQASGIWAALKPTLSTGGNCIIMSTAFGMGNFFHQAWVNSVQKLNMLFPVQLHWQMHPEYNAAWYAEQRMDLGFRRCMQEIDCDFLQSGMNVFNMDKIKAIEARLNERQPFLRERVGFEGEILYYFKYDPARTYTLGADISTGRSKDYSAFSVYDDRGKEVACYKGKILPRLFAHVMMKVGYKYGMAIIAPEINSIGEAPLAILQEQEYPNIFHDVSSVLKRDEWLPKESAYMGWLTTHKSRHEMITGFDEDLENELIEPWNPYMVKEAYTFVYNDNNKPIALGKGGGSSKSSEFYGETGKSYSDDAIIAECITNAVRKNPSNQGTYKPVFLGGT